MSWFTAMECCYFNKGYLAEPQNEEEQAKIVEYITAGHIVKFSELLPTVRRLFISDWIRA